MLKTHVTKYGLSKLLGHLRLQVDELGYVHVLNGKYFIGDVCFIMHSPLGLGLIPNPYNRS